MVRLVLLGMAGVLAAGPAGATSCADRLMPPALRTDAQPRPIRAEDLIELRDFGEPGQTAGASSPFAVSPDGRRIALAIRRADIATNSYCYGLLIVSLDGAPPHLADIGGEPLITMTDYLGIADKRNGVVIGSAVAWSPDGKALAWLRRDQGHTQLWIAGPDGGAGHVLTREPVDVRKFAWTPDGRALRFRTRPAVADAEARFAAESETGYLYDERFLANAASRPLAASSLGYVEKQIVVATGEVVGVEPEPAPADVPPGASRVARSDNSVAWLAPRDPGVFLGSSKLTARIGSAETMCSALACIDGVVGMWWSSPTELLFLRDWGIEGSGRMTLFRWHPGHGDPQAIRSGEDLLIGCQKVGDGLLCAQESAGQPRRLIQLDPRRGQVRAVFDPNPEWRAIRLGATLTLPATASDGVKSFARLVLPPSHRTGQRHPLVVVQYTSRGFLRGGTGDEYPMRLLAERGYAVLSFQKPRPPAADSTPKDVDSWVRMNLMGLADRRRIDSALDSAVNAAIDLGVVDPDRIGITGLSDGSSTVAFALLNRNRYRAAIISTCCDEPSFTHSVAGRGYAAVTTRWGYPGYGEIGLWKDYSLALNAARVQAPLLIQAADEEFRVALDTVAALDAAHKPVEMYVFPGEYHVKWQPRHRSAIYARVVDWFDFWLLGRTDPDPGKAEQYRRWQALAELQRSSAAAAP